jgi:hypothetical protein
MEAEDTGGICHQATTGEDTADWEGFAHAVVICKVYKSVRLLKLFVVTSFKSSKKSNYQPKPHVYSLNQDNMLNICMSTLL